MTEKFVADSENDSISDQEEDLTVEFSIRDEVDSLTAALETFLVSVWVFHCYTNTVEIVTVLFSLTS